MVRLAIVVAMLVIPSWAAGERLDLQFGASAEYDSNALRSSRNEEDDVIFRLFPAGTLYRDEGDLRYSLRYAVPFEQGVRFGEDISDFDHIVNFRSSWTLDQANEFYATNDFRYDRSVTQRFARDSDVPDVSNRRDRILTNRAIVGLNHAFSARTTGGLSFSHQIYETEQVARQDNMTFGATTDLNYVLDPKNRVGGGFAFILQDFEEAGGVPSSQTFFYNAFGSWVYQFDEVTTLSITAGPTLIQSDQDPPPSSVSVLTTPTVLSGGQLQVFDFATCGLSGPPGMQVPVFAGCSLVSPPMLIDLTPITAAFAPGTQPPSRSDLNITGFGNVRLSRRWTPTVSSSLAYQRRQSSASGLGGSTILDAVTAVANWTIDQWWDAQLRLDFTHRESVSDSTQTFLIVQPGPNGEAQFVDTVMSGNPGLTSQLVKNSIETNRWGVGGRLARKIGRRAEASLRLNYNQQDSKRGTRGGPSDFDNFLAIFGVRYRFEPIRLW